MSDIGLYSANTIVQGHVLNVLGRLPDESVHCCVTSPPYWGLRAYGTQAQVWGGDRECEHDWGDEQPNLCQTAGLTEKQMANKGSYHSGGSNAFCSLCGAWRGELGLEPSPEQFVSHLVEIFREVKRVLRKDGTLWLNLGMSYWGGKGQSNYAFQERRTSESIEGDPHNITSMGETRPQDGIHGIFKPKDLVPIPWMAAMALQQDGWWLRSSIIWAKGVSFCPTYSGSCMPESVRDRPTQSYEYVFLLTKSKRYYYDVEAVKEPLACPDAADGTRVFGGVNKHGANVDHGERTTGRVYDSAPSGRNLRSVWTINPHPFPEAHFATYPPELITPMVLAGTSSRGCCAECGSPWKRVMEKTDEVDPSAKGSRFDRGKTADHQLGRAQNGERYVSQTTGWQPTCSCGHENTEPAIVLDPFIGSGTTALVALEHNRNFLGIELNPEYIKMAEERINIVQPRLL